MKKYVKFIVNYIFKNYNINIIIAKTFTTNISSQKVLLANNFNELITLLIKTISSVIYQYLNYLENLIIIINHISN